MIWENYFLRSGIDFQKFWSHYLVEKNRDILCIMGMGFDPRTNVGIKTIYSIKSEGKRDTFILRYFKTQEETTEPNNEKVQKHLNELSEFLKEQEYSEVQTKNIIQRSDDDKSVASISATQLFSDKELEIYSDIVVDISAMPRGVFLPLLNRLLTLVNLWNKAKVDKKNLHVIVTENSTLDSHISDRGEADEANYIHGLGIREVAKTKDHKEVWIPLLGEKQTKQYETISKEIDPAEVCPILPFSSTDLKRSDRLIIEYQDLLFNDAGFDAKNVIYADERNPFQVYRLIYKAIKRYDKSLNILNGCKVIISVFSSKLLTVGAFLAVYESRLDGKNTGIKHVESLGHQLDPSIEKELEKILNENNLVELWLAGNPYD